MIPVGRKTVDDDFKMAAPLATKDRDSNVLSAAVSAGPSPTHTNTCKARNKSTLVKGEPFNNHKRLHKKVLLFQRFSFGVSLPLCLSLCLCACVFAEIGHAPQLQTLASRDRRDVDVFSSLFPIGTGIVEIPESTVRLATQLPT